MITPGQTWRLDGAETTLVFVACGHDNIDLAYLGPRLPQGEEGDVAAQLARYGRHENQLDNPPVQGLFPQPRHGLRDAVAMQLLYKGKLVDARFELVDVKCDDHRLTIRWAEQSTAMHAELDWDVEQYPAIRISLSFSAKHAEDIVVVRAPPLTIPLPRHIAQMTSFGGRWAKEMQPLAQPIESNAIEMRAIGGKPGFDPGSWLVFDDETDRQCLGMHCGSLDDQITRCGLDQEGRPFLSVEAVMPSGGISLPGQQKLFTRATIIRAGDHDALTRAFHNHAREHILPDRKGWPARKVHINSWEAVGFKLEESALKALADEAADLGIERFVLDDGWFKGRRSDNAGLGDWTVDKDVFPNGLQPLIEHVQALGMDFGLWVEPEMVSPDSDLYREHPDWCLGDGTAEPPTERNQLVLDLSRQQVFDHVLRAICALIDAHDIAYLKWDHNRRLPPGCSWQEDAAIRLKAQVREKYPEIEIESCSSGGGQISYPVLHNSHRVWPSDNNDPIERLSIMDGWSRFLPLEILGNHVGPERNPITGRQTSMDFRAKAALFGHMGVEADVRAMSDKDKTVLRDHIALYKQWRDILHSGDYWQLDHPDPHISAKMVTGGDRAIVLVAQTEFSPSFNTAPVRLKGLEPERSYQISLPRPWPRKARHYLADPERWEDGMVASGRLCRESGLALPLTHPETAWIITLEAVDI